MKKAPPIVRSNALDRLVAMFSPSAGLARVAARSRLATLLHYEGAAKGRRTASWKSPGTSGTTAAVGQLSTLRNRSRDLTRNSGWAKKALRTIENNVVGTGIVPRILSEDTKLRDEILDRFNAWGVDSAECDVRGKHNLYGLQRLAMRTVAESGAALIRKRPRRLEDGLSVPLQLEVLEPDYIDTSRLEPTRPGHQVIEGVEIDALERVVGYWLYRSHPGDWGLATKALVRATESRFVPASELLHIFDEERAGAMHGIPFPHAAIIRLKAIEDADGAQLERIKIAACFVALVHDIDASRVGEAADTEEEAPETVEPGMYWNLPPGKEVTFGTPPSVGDYPQYTVQMLRGVAAAYGITYEQLTGDLSGVNFSSGRMGWIEADRNVQRWQSDVMVVQFCAPTWRWWQDALEIAEGIDFDPLRVSWNAPRREMLDPVKETAARISEVRAGFRSLSSVIREAGGDPRQTLEELAADADLLAELGLNLDTDPRTGPPAKGGASDDDEDDEEKPKPPRAKRASARNRHGSRNGVVR